MSIYRKKIVKVLEEKLEAARQGKVVSHHINLHQPVNMMKEYGKMLKQLEMTTQETLDLTQEQFSS